MHNIILILSTIALLVGCSSKEEKALMEAYEKKKSYHQRLQKTEKIQLYDGLITKAMLTATYLNEQVIDKENKPDEVFVVGIYIEEGEEESFDEEGEEESFDKDTEDESFDAEGYSLTLNGKAPKSIKILKADDPILKNISFVSEWNYFYLVTFPHVSRKNFNMVFVSDLYGKGTLHFAKVAKYVLTKRAF